jgi:phosphoribosylformylglycinamidine cyclo-ligase
MAPHLTYLPSVLPLVERGLIHGMAHITGGGLLDNVPRMLPEGLAAEFDRATWSVNPIFTYLVEAGRLSPEERYRALNMGLGFVLAIAPGDSATVLGELSTGRIVGRVVEAGEDGRRVRGLTEGGNADG